MSPQGISVLERGYRRTPQRATLALLAGALALDDDQRRELEGAAARWVLLRERDGASVTVGPWPDAATSNLPLALTSFVGREPELAEIATLAREHRLVTLTGSGGVGKTQTALQVARALSDAEDDAVCFVGLAPVGDPSLVEAAVASALGVQEVPRCPLRETLLAYLKKKSLLLILDNCEHVITEAASIAVRVLADCPRVRILATSREPIGAAGERAYRLPSLTLPSPEAAEQLTAAEAAAYGAIVLFADRARAVNHRFALTDENAPTVAALCRHLDGIPLAIELAAAQLDFLSVKAVAKMLEDRFRILARGKRTALPRHQTMRATIDWSYELLAVGEKRLFEHLSVFAGGCTLTTAVKVCVGEDLGEEHVVDLLASLVDKSLIVADLEGSEPRYRLLESFRQYACEKLMARGEQQVVSRRHVRVCLALAEQLDRAFDTEPYGIWRTLIQHELDNWRAALQWALSNRGDIVLGQRLVGELSVVWLNFALEGRRWLASALELVDEKTPTTVLAALTYAEATIAHALSDYRLELASSEKAILHYRTAGDLLGVARAQSRAAHALASLGQTAEAKTRLLEALADARTLGNGQLAAFILRLLAYSGTLDGDLVAARGYITEALSILEAMGNKLTVALAIDDLGELEFRAGNPELALRNSTDALAALRTLNEKRKVAYVLTNMSAYLISLARYDEAEQCAREALEVARQQKHGVTLAFALDHFGAIATLRPQVLAGRRATVLAQAARILGFVGARLAAMGSARAPVQEQQYDRVVTVLRDAMDDETVANLMAAGATMPEEQAIHEALEIWANA